MITIYTVGVLVAFVLISLAFVVYCHAQQVSIRPVAEDVRFIVLFAILWPIAVVFGVVLWLIATLAPDSWLRRLDQVDKQRRPW